MKLQTPFPQKMKLAIVSTILDEWGGSEELWFKSIRGFQMAGFEVVFMRRNLNKQHPKYRQLTSMGVGLEELYLPLKIKKSKRLQRALALLLDAWYFLLPTVSKFVPGTKKTYPNPVQALFKNKINQYKPALVIISQGINFDGLTFARTCANEGFPFVLIAQKAVDFYWPPAGQRNVLANVLQVSRINFFVSEHNKKLTEEQFGMRLPNSRVIFNPVKWPEQIFPFPETDTGYHFACVGRLFLLDKGQDILLRVLAQREWRQRPFSLTFFGTGPDLEGLQALAQLLNLENIRFAGHLEDVSVIWKDFHALILPSRSEGLPLAVIEAMAAQRPVIVTNAGGNAEVVEEGVTGFIGQANQESFGEAMERAWNMRSDWEKVGKAASAFVRNRIPAEPELDFVHAVTEIVNEA